MSCVNIFVSLTDERPHCTVW